MTHRWKETAPLLLALLAATGCVRATTIATFVGTKTPVLLGPRDRVGPSATPLAFTKVKDFEAEAYWVFKQGSSVSGNIRTTWSSEEQTTAAALPHAAFQATGDDPTLDIRLTMVKPRSYVVMCGMKSKSLIALEGDVGTVGGGK
jgi:hypothetical protein